MQQPHQELKGNSIVLIGVFRPSTAHPAELLKSQLIRPEDMVDLKLEAIVPDLVSISFSWISLVVEATRLTANTTLAKPLPEPVRDFVVDFAEEQEGVRIDALGVNTDYHFQASLERWHNIGDVLASKAPWEPLLRTPRTQAVIIKAGRDDGRPGHVIVRVEPSARMEQGVYIQVNDHYELPEAQAARAPKRLLEVLETDWSKTLERADNIIASLKKIGHQ
jgi:hypothetical protein